MTLLELFGTINTQQAIFVTDSVTIRLEGTTSEVYAELKKADLLDLEVASISAHDDVLYVRAKCCF